MRHMDRRIRSQSDAITSAPEPGGRIGCRTNWSSRDTCDGLMTGVYVGEVNFNTTAFSANVKMAGGNQQVEVTVDIGTMSAQTAMFTRP